MNKNGIKNLSRVTIRDYDSFPASFGSLPTALRNRQKQAAQLLNRRQGPMVMDMQSPHPVCLDGKVPGSVK